MGKKLLSTNQITTTMLQPNELRIGNWVFDDCNEPCQISSLNSRKKAIFEGWDSDYGAEGPLVEYPDKDGIYISETINPIPLTAEWLERCGFADEGKSVFVKDYFKIGVSQHGGANWVFYFDRHLSLNYLAYLHQLQNLYFALTGQELAIKAP